MAKRKHNYIRVLPRRKPVVKKTENIIWSDDSLDLYALGNNLEIVFLQQSYNVFTTCALCPQIREQIQVLRALTGREPFNGIDEHDILDLFSIDPNEKMHKGKGVTKLRYVSQQLRAGYGLYIDSLGCLTEFAHLMGPHTFPKRKSWKYYILKELKKRGKSEKYFKILEPVLKVIVDGQACYYAPEDYAFSYNKKNTDKFMEMLKEAIKDKLDPKECPI